MMPDFRALRNSTVALPRDGSRRSRAALTASPALLRSNFPSSRSRLRIGSPSHCSLLDAPSRKRHGCGASGFAPRRDTYWRPHRYGWQGRPLQHGGALYRRLIRRPRRPSIGASRNPIKRRRYVLRMNFRVSQGTTNDRRRRHFALHVLTSPPVTVCRKGSLK